MAETPDIKITIDQDALREQVAAAIQETLRDAAAKLRMAADALDGGEWWSEHNKFCDEQIAEAREDGFNEGRAESEGRES